MAVGWLVFAVSSYLLIGALAMGWELLRTAPAPQASERRTAAQPSSVALYFVNQGLIAPALAVVLARIGAAVHPDRLGATPRFAQIAVSLVAFEAVTYALHRLAHRVPCLFRFHRVHHEASDLCWLDAFRQHPIEFALFQGLGNLPSVILFGPVGHLSLWLNVALRLWTAWLHARGPVSLGPLESVLTSPAMHHAHHRKRAPGTSAPRGVNYGGMLSVFDWMGGTAETSRSGGHCDQGQRGAV